jgi:hypothetical protein
MNLRSEWPDATAVHAALAPVNALLAERRALYQLAVELYAPDRPPMPDTQLDNPLFRFRVGEALAGRGAFDPTIDDRLDGLTDELNAGPAQLGVVSASESNDRFAQAMRLIHEQSGAPGAPPRLLTEADGEAFRESIAVVRAGLAKVREVSPDLSDDLLPHSRLLAVLDPGTSGGLVSASSRLFPGLILLDKPSCPYDVAEALIHEGAHQKFFDLAITHDFLGADLSGDRFFHPSWSGAKWPVEQVIAAFHAYACMAQFAEDVIRAGEVDLLGKNSLLLSAREREAEIGQWMLEAEEALESDARWFLRTFLRQEEPPVRSTRAEAVVLEGNYQLDPLVRVSRIGDTGRVLLARPGNPPALLWLNGPAGKLVDQLGTTPFSSSGLGPQEAATLAGLVGSSVVRRVPETLAN